MEGEIAGLKQSNDELKVALQEVKDILLRFTREEHPRSGRFIQSNARISDRGARATDQNESNDDFQIANGFPITAFEELQNWIASMMHSRKPIYPLPVIGTFHTSSVRDINSAPWDGDSAKVFTFPKPYSSLPGIVVALTSLDVANDHIRVKCHTSHVAQTRFVMHIETWDTTHLYKASCAWLEIGPEQWDFQFGSYCTDEDHDWRNPPRENTRRVLFAQPYTTPPRVVVWLSGLDMNKDKNWRVRVSATDITERGFTLHIDTWGNSELNVASASWVAYTAGLVGVLSGSLPTSGCRSLSGHQRFRRGVFHRPPRVMVGISSLDIDQANHLRLAVGAETVEAEGMDWYLRTWGGSILYSASASYIAMV